MYPSLRTSTLDTVGLVEFASYFHYYSFLKGLYLHLLVLAFTVLQLKPSSVTESQVGLTVFPENRLFVQLLPNSVLVLVTTYQMFLFNKELAYRKTLTSG